MPTDSTTVAWDRVTVEQAIAAGASRALLKRAAALRVSAGSQKTWIKDQKGRDVEIGTPEATIMLQTAILFEECAADITGGAP